MSKPRTPILRKSRPKKTNPARRRKEFARCYGSKERVEFVKSRPCAACGVVGYSENAHLLGNGGMGRKADADTIGPLCGKHFTGPSGAAILSLYQGCHSYYDRFPGHFRDRFPDFDPAKVARETEKAWVEEQRDFHLRGKLKHDR